MNEFMFGSDKIVIKEGKKDPYDYVIFHNDVQITDKFSFEGLLINISNEKEAKIFIEVFTGCGFIKFKKNMLETSPSPLDIKKIYEYCINSKLKPKLRKLLFLTILRCDIDNICYPPPAKNGCIRAFVQILLLFSYRFRWTTYINKNSIPADIAQYIYDMGFQKGIKSIVYFKKVYEQYLKNGI